MNDWIEVNGWKEVPKGNWLVQLAHPFFGCYMDVIKKGENLCIIGNFFASASEKVIAYQALPEAMEYDSSDDVSIASIAELEFAEWQNKRKELIGS